MMLMPNTNNLTNALPLAYVGDVTIKYMLHNKELIFNRHNEGLDGLFLFLCKALAENTATLYAEKPTYLDVCYIYTDDTGEHRGSCLYGVVPISNPHYFYDATISSWITVYNITLSYSMLKQTILINYADADYYLYLLSGNQVDCARMLLDDSSEALRKIEPGVQAIIEWTLRIINASTV